MPPKKKPSTQQNTKWSIFNAKIMGLSESALASLVKTETRKTYKRRVHQRLVRVRAARERAALTK